MSESVPASSVRPNMRRAAGFASAEAQFTISAETRQSLAKNKVTLEDPLGKPGAYGAVFAATDELRRKLAVKIVKNPNDRTVRKRHQRECQVLGSSQIPADLIPTLFFLHKAKVPGDLGRPDASGDSSDTSDMADNVAPYIVMSRILGKEIHEYVGGDRPLSMSERIDLVEKTFEALGRLHDAGIAHGDLSPRNVLVEPGNRIRFVDFGNSKDIGKALLSLNSTCTGGGTEGFAPTAQLTGEAPVSAATDIRALSAVAYVALTGQLHKEGMKPQESRDALRVAGVPAGIASIISKGLIVPDPKKNRDSRVFASATEVVEAIAAWRRSQARRRQLTLMAPIFAVMFLLLGGAGWKLLADAHERRWQTVEVLRSQLGEVSASDAASVRSLVEEADQARRESAAENWWQQASLRPERLARAESALRQALGTRRQLERLLPRYTTLGDMWQRIRWQADAPGLDARNSALRSDFDAIRKLLDAGDADNAGPRLEQFASRLVGDWEANERARTAGNTRAEYQRLLQSVPERLRSTARYGELKVDGDQAGKQWSEAGTVEAFALADASFGSARQRLSDWLAVEETADEKTARVKDTAEEVTRLSAQLLDEQSRASSLAKEIERLRTQYAELGKLNQADRLAKQAADSKAADLETKLKTEATARAAAEAKAAEQAQLATQKTTELQQRGVEKQAIEAKLAEAEREAKRVQDLQADLEASRRALTLEQSAATKFREAADQSREAAEKAFTDARAAEQARAEAQRKQEAAEREKARAAVELATRPASNGSLSPTTFTRPGVGTKAGDLLTLEVKGVPVRFRWCPPGTFRMGSPVTEAERYTDENPEPVTLTQGYWIMETECWQKLWEIVMGSSKDWDRGRSDQHPAYYVSHEDAVEFAKRFEATLRQAGIAMNGWSISLPTEAQWEYAIRGGTTTAYCFGDNASQLGDYAWYSENSGGTTHPVGTKKPNAWGIRDGHGSLREWTNDVWADKLSGGTNPKGPTSGSYRVNRGGSWGYSPGYCRSAYRLRYSPGYRNDFLGCRLALVPVAGS